MTSAETPSTGAAVRRDGERRLLLGVCAGVARRLDADPAIVRGAAILLGLLTGPLAVIAYVGAAAILPRDDGRMLLGGHPADRRESVIGWSGIAVSCVLLLAAAPRFDAFWVERPLSSPLLVVALLAGVVTLAWAGRERAGGARGAAAPPEGAAASDAPPAGSATASTAVVAREGASVGPSSGGPEASTAVHPRGPQAPAAVHPRGPEAPTAVSPAPEPRRRSVFPPVAGALLGAAAVAVVIGASGAADLSARAVAIMLAGGALACGTAAAFAAGRRGTGATLALGIVLALGAAGVAAAHDQLDDGVGVRTVRPASTAQLRPEYRLGVGVLELDLRHTALGPGSTTPVKADLGAGEIQLRVGPGVRVVSTGRTVAGGDLDPLVTRPAARTPVVALDGHVDAGAVRVLRDGA